MKLDILIERDLIGKILYFLTPVKYLQSILKNGLKGSENTPLLLFTSVDSALDGLTGYIDEFDEQRVALLKVTLPHPNINVTSKNFTEYSDFIPPENIKLITNNF